MFTAPKDLGFCALAWTVVEETITLPPPLIGTTFNFSVELFHSRPVPCSKTISGNVVHHLTVAYAPPACFKESSVQKSSMGSMKALVCAGGTARV